MHILHVLHVDIGVHAQSVLVFLDDRLNYRFKEILRLTLGTACKVLRLHQRQKLFLGHVEIRVRRDTVQKIVVRAFLLDRSLIHI